MTPSRTRPLCARCGDALWPGIHYCFGSAWERKLARANAECRAEIAREKPVEVRRIPG